MQPHMMTAFVQSVVTNYAKFGKPVAVKAVAEEFQTNWDFAEHVVEVTVLAWDISLGDIEQTKDAFFCAFVMKYHDQIREVYTAQDFGGFAHAA